MRYRVIDSMAELSLLCDKLVALNEIVFADTETTSLNPRTCKLVAVQLKTEKSKCYIIDMRQATDEWFVDLALLAEKVPWVFHNASYDYQVLAANGITVARPHCTKLGEQVLYGLGDEDAKAKGMPLTLAALVGRYCGVEMSKEARSWFFDVDKRPDEWDAPFPTEELEYMALDIEYLPRIFSEQQEALRHAGLLTVYGLEMRALPSICSMEMNGISVDVGGWRAVIAEKEAEARQLEGKSVEVFGEAIRAVRQRQFDAKQAEYDAWVAERDAMLVAVKASWSWDHSDKPGWGDYKNQRMKEWRAEHPNPGKPKLSLEVNIGSSKQLLDAFGELGIDLETTGKDELERAMVEHPELRVLVEFRQAQKFVTSFGEKLLAYVEEDGRIHPQYQQLGTSTGRMSCRHPNWQQIPARTETGKRLRQCVIAALTHKLLTADYSIIELRILAEMSGDENMLSMFASGEDLHSYTARKMFDIPDDVDVKTHLLPSGLKARDVAKTINYGVAYGQSAFGFALKFGVDVKTAQGFIDEYYRLYAGAGKWLNERARFSIKNGYSQTILGRKRFYEKPGPEPKPKWSDEWREWSKKAGSVGRAGKNSPIQGSSADMTKLALAYIYKHLKPTWKIVACVHDEIVLEVPEEDAADAKVFLASWMLEAANDLLKNVDVPRPDVHVGDCWEK